MRSPLLAFGELAKSRAFKPHPSQIAACAALQGERGVYMHGNVGVGKTTLAQSLDKAAFLHYEDLLQLLNRELHILRAKRGHVREPVRFLARKLAAGKLMGRGRMATVIVDELQLPTVQDCTMMIPFLDELSRWARLIVTSNRAPDQLCNVPNLYPTLKVQLEHTLARLNECLVVGVDYRRDGDAAACPLFAQAPDDAFLNDWQDRLAGRSCVQMDARNDLLTFGAFSAANLHALAREVDAVLLKNVPVFPLGGKDGARRFALLIEALYAQRTLLVATLDAPADELFKAFRSLPGASPGPVGRCGEHRCGGCTYSQWGPGQRCAVQETQDLAFLETSFAAERAASRLAEMCTQRYAAASKALSTAT